MLRVRFKPDVLTKITTIVQGGIQEKQSLMILFGYIGGLAYFFYLVLTPCFRDNRLILSLIQNLYWINEITPVEHSSVKKWS